MSFLSVEPQSRVLLKSHSNILLARFDTQLGITAHRYLAFFQERRRIEATYIDSLRKLHRKATSADASIDPRAEPTTTRTAWDKVRDSLEREASTQQGFVDILDNDVIKPLSILKETEDQTRKRVKDDLEESATKYADHAENTVLKLQEAYLKKYHHSNDDSRSPQDNPNRWFGGGLFGGRREPARSEEVSADDCRRAVSLLNTLRLERVENLEGGYDSLEDLVFAPTIKNVLVKYMDGVTTVCTKYDELATSTRAEVKEALAGTDTSDLRASFRRATSFSTPPLTLYRNHPTDAYSDLVFGVPMVDLANDGDNVPKVMRMCIKEVEKRGLNTNKIYSVGSILDAEVLQLRRRFESEASFSFRSTDNIHLVAMLLKLYLEDHPEPLFMLSVRDYRQYTQNRARFTENNFSVLRSKIRELHPVHKASLGALLRHLLRVASRSGKNAMTVEALAAQFCHTILRGNAGLEGGVHVKKLVMEDLIQNAHTLFDERPPPSPPAISPHVAETAPTPIYGSSSGPGFSRSAEAQAMGSAIRRRTGHVGGIPTSNQSSFSTSHPGSPVEGRPTPAPTPLLSPLLGFPSSPAPEGRVETTMQEQAIPEAREPRAVETLTNSALPNAAPRRPTSVPEWRLRLPQPQLHQHPPALTTDSKKKKKKKKAPITPQSPSGSVLSSTSEFSISAASVLSSTTDFSVLAAASPQSTTGIFSPVGSEWS